MRTEAQSQLPRPLQIRILPCCALPFKSRLAVVAQPNVEFVGCRGSPLGLFPSVPISRLSTAHGKFPLGLLRQILSTLGLHRQSDASDIPPLSKAILHPPDELHHSIYYGTVVFNYCPAPLPSSPFPTTKASWKEPHRKPQRGPLAATTPILGKRKKKKMCALCTLHHLEAKKTRIIARIFADPIDCCWRTGNQCREAPPLGRKGAKLFL